MYRSDKNRLSRREALTLATAGVAGFSPSGWFGRLAVASPRRRPGKACILLWMDGGPSQKETFDPKPGTEHAGPISTVPTAIPSVRIGEHFPKMARLLKQASLVRSMSTREADHGRARINLHTGHPVGAGGLTYPTLGATVAEQLGDEDSPLASFVACGTPRLPKYTYVASPGYLGPRFNPLIVPDTVGGVANLHPRVPDVELAVRAEVLAGLNERFVADHAVGPAADHAAAGAKAVQLMRSSASRVFTLGDEPAAVRERYGDHEFGRGCLLARRLVEAGVSFIEVYQSDWDTHDAKRAAKVPALCRQTDQGMAALITDLHDRGLLDTTLVVWMGEFGRSPKVLPGGGRDHHSRAWSTLLAGGGVKGGQVVGRTDKDAAEVEDRPVSASDFLATICQAIGIDHRHEYDAPGGRPVRVVEKGATPIRELVG